MALIQPYIEKILINLNAPANFNLRHKILGDQNANIQFIVNETKANASLRGRGSGFIEANGIESNEPMHLYIEHPNLKNLIEAKNLARNLLETIQQDLQVFLQTNPSSQVIPIQQPPPIIQANQQPITLPSISLSVPPPIIHNSSIQPTHIIQQPNFLPQSQIIPQPMQIIQNIPPPTAIPIRTATTATAAPISVQFQGQPNNIQLQSTAGQQILVNQTPTQQYQLQYIPTANQAPTIQHFIQPQQQIQGILQPNGQQFITVQGNTAFMLPPPNITTSQNIGTVFNSAPPIAINTIEEKDKIKSDEQKTQTHSNIAARININQPPPSIQQFIAWPQNQQQIQQIPINSSQQIQILTQPPPTTAHNGQQVIATFNSQQGPPLQQIQFTQPLITQPPPPTQPIQIQNVQGIMEPRQSQTQQATSTCAMNQALSYQQQFEQKINISMMNENQQRAMKRKIDDTDTNLNKSFPKTGMGSMTKTHAPPPILQQQLHQSMTLKNNSNNNNKNRTAMAKVSMSNTIASTSENMSINNNKNNSNKSVYNKNNTTSMTAKINVSQVDTKSMKPSKSDNDFSEVSSPPPVIIHQNFVDMQNQFMQPPPNMQFNQSRAQMMIPPPTIQIQQQDINSFPSSASGSNNFIQQAHINRFNAPTRMIVPNENSNMIAGSSNYQQSPRFQRQQWQ
ncbi:hypothetical protein PVAND_003639 [Polypedilum vanderplanki]|uniref:KH homology domain-containing protein 4 n=1 Tax=Polypedilum vanderplanki TaxID=319348 RepID=A0A9J6BUN8_POLVA|nr:hypothetical protein PVAND_003639 [Polypedilum vanderplanki]